MGARLAGTVLVTDPDTHQTAVLEAGTVPEMRLAVLVTNPVAWEGGRVPDDVKRAAAGEPPEGTDGGKDPGGDPPPDGSSPEPAASADTEPDAGTPEPELTLPEATEPQAEPAPKKPAARKTAAKKRAAAEGTGGQ